MPVTWGFKALKGAQTHVEKFSPALANLIRDGFDSLERKAEANKDGVLYWFGTRVFPILGKIGEIYLNVVDSEELMADAYLNTTISLEEFEKLKKQGKALSPHVVKEKYK